PSHPLISRTLVDAHAGSCTEVEALRFPVDRHGDGRVAQLQISSAHPPRLVAEHPGGPGGQVKTCVPGMVEVVGLIVGIGGEHLKTTSTREIRSEEHTSELQSRFEIVCRLLLEKKNEITTSGRFTLRTSLESRVYRG